MDIINIQCIKGKNIHSHKPVIKAILDLGELYDTPTKDIQGFNEGLLELFPGFAAHYCSLGHEGGFLERLEEGTYLAHITEHMVLEIQNVMGYEAHYGKSRILQSPSLYFIIFEYKNEKLAVESLISAVEIINSLIAGNRPEIEAILKHLQKVDAETGLGPSTKAIYEEAGRRGIPVTRLCNESILQLGYGKYSRVVEASLTDKPSCIAIDIAGNKHLTKQILSGNDIPVPYGDIAYTLQAALLSAAHMGYPVVVKPLDANQGKGVTLNIKDGRELEQAYGEAAKFSKGVIVEKFIAGKDYRILVVGDRVSAVSERMPPFVTGDGVHTVEELAAIENENPLRGDDHERQLTRIKLDGTAIQVLQRYGLAINSVPLSGQTVFLRENGNLSTGGTARDCTEDIHPFNAAIAVKAAGLLGLDVAGVDLTARDISVPVKRGEGAVIEVNAAPGLRMHLYPSQGPSRNVTKDIMDMIYPEGQPYTIPIVSITGTNGKTTVTRLVSHILALTGKTVGMTTTSGIFIGNQCISKGDNTGPVSAGMILSDKRVEAAVLETARGGIVRKGLGYDLSDVGVVVNISDDHLGIDGINTLEDLAFAKALVIEAVKKEGYAVLNADDEMTPFLLKRVRSKVILFTRRVDNLLVFKHVESGGKSVCVRDGSVYFDSMESENFVIKLEDVPITFDGKAECNVENSLAAISALFALDIPAELIRAGLKTFRPDVLTNPGRFNIIDMGDFRVMLDYGHNPAGYNAVTGCMSTIPAHRYVGVIGMPGDRSDRNINEVGKICGQSFAQLYIKEDSDLRGRLQGEVADLLYDAAISAGISKECVEVIHSELKALETAIMNAQQGDLIVVFYEDFDAALKLVEGMKSEKINAAPDMAAAAG